MCLICSRFSVHRNTAFHIWYNDASWVVTSLFIFHQMSFNVHQCASLFQGHYKFAWEILIGTIGTNSHQKHSLLLRVILITVCIRTLAMRYFWKQVLPSGRAKQWRWQVWYLRDCWLSSTLSTREVLVSWELFSDTSWMIGRNWAEGLIDLDGLGHEASQSVLYVQSTEQHRGYYKSCLQIGEWRICIYQSWSLLQSWVVYLEHQ